MNIMEQIYEKAKKKKQRVAFTEITEEKTFLAAIRGYEEGLFLPYLIGDEDEICSMAEYFHVSVDKLQILDLKKSNKLDDLITDYLKKKESILSEKALRRKAKDPMYIALMLEAIGEIDLTFAGLTHTTGEVILAGQTIIGYAKDCSTISSVAVFDIPDYEGSEGTLLAFGDSAVCVNPNADELADIAISACDTVTALLDWTPRCAMLSYSTCGSGESELVEKVVNAVEIANKKRPELAIDGEFQLDSALRMEVAKKKVNRESRVAGQANIIIWPDINAGNIGVKLVQQFAHANAYGPMLQGLDKIVCDCSRSASVDDMLGNIALSCVRSAAKEIKWEVCYENICDQSRFDFNKNCYV